MSLLKFCLQAMIENNDTTFVFTSGVPCVPNIIWSFLRLSPINNSFPLSNSILLLIWPDILHFRRERKAKMMVRKKKRGRRRKRGMGKREKTVKRRRGTNKGLQKYLTNQRLRGSRTQHHRHDLLFEPNTHFVDA